MTLIRIAHVTLLLLLVGGCAHENSQTHQKSPAPPSAGMPLAEVSVIRIGNELIPLVDREPFVVHRKAEGKSSAAGGEQSGARPVDIQLRWAPGRDVTRVRVKIVPPVALKPEALEEATRLKKFEVKATASCPLAGKVGTKLPCECDMGKDGHAVCNFAVPLPVVFRYDVCVTTSLDQGNREHCIDPYGMIN